MKKHLLLFTLAFGVTVALMSAQQPPAEPGPFTAAQAASGRTAYEQNCAGCHGPDLRGVPALSGPAFIGGWSTRSTRDLFNTIRASMPPGDLVSYLYGVARLGSSAA